MRARRTLLLALVFGALTPGSAAAADCPGADLIPDAKNLPAVRSALVCLHNRERAKRHLPRLAQDARLRRAAVRHSADMIDAGYFGHGSSFPERLVKAARPRAGWEFGENLAWGAGELATPRAVMAAWMKEPGQRGTILMRAYRKIGIGIRLGLPSDSSVGATMTADLSS